MNTQIKHTPGPWHIGLKPGPMIYGQNGGQVADCRCIDLLGRDEAQANLALIAAAPALLGALQSLLAVYIESTDDSGSPVVLNAQEAIAQAEGRQA